MRILRDYASVPGEISITFSPGIFDLSNNIAVALDDPDVHAFELINNSGNGYVFRQNNLFVGPVLIDSDNPAGRTGASNELQVARNQQSYAEFSNPTVTPGAYNSVDDFASFFRLSSTSPALDSGVGSQSDGVDITGRARPVGTAVDRGAVEGSSAPVALSDIINVRRDGSFGRDGVFVLDIDYVAPGPRVLAATIESASQVGPAYTDSLLVDGGSGSTRLTVRGDAMVLPKGAPYLLHLSSSAPGLGHGGERLTLAGTVCPSCPDTQPPLSVSLLHGRRNLRITDATAARRRVTISVSSASGATVLERKVRFNDAGTTDLALGTTLPAGLYAVTVQVPGAALGADAKAFAKTAKLVVVR